MDHPHTYSLALVTGASSGIGAALCRLLAGKGIPLLLTGRDEKRLHALADELKEKVAVAAFTADLATSQGRKSAVEQIHAHKPDLVVNNAGFGLYGPALAHATQEQLEIVEVDAVAVLELTLEAARTMVNGGRQGTVLNVSSAAGFQVFPMLATYSATKAFVNQLSESLDYEMRPQGVRVLAACPGMVATGFRARAAGAPAAERAGDPLVMSAAFAAEQLWWQIEKGRSLYIFDWKTRLGTWLARYLLPKSVVAKVLSRNIRQRL